MNLKDLITPNLCNWCPGCGNFGIWAAFKNAAVAQDWNNFNTALVAGIGCHGHILNFLKMSSFEGLHGRAIPVGAGIKIANNKLNVFVFTGDGDCLAEGGNHFVQAARRNHDMTVILHDNAVYALTTGQTSPRSPHGFRSKSTPAGNLDEPLHPLRLALAAGATFLARCYEGDIKMLTELMIKANEHKGFAVIQILQPCVTFNSLYTHTFFQQNIYKLSDDYNKNDKQVAFAKTMEWGEKQIPVGILYQSQEPTCEEQINKNLSIESVEKREISDLFVAYS